MTAGELSPDWCLHPGEILAETLKAKGVRQSELANRTGLSAKHVNQMIKQLIGISPDVAILLERALDMPAQFWIEADARYQSYESRRRAAASLASYLPWADQFDRTTLVHHKIIGRGDIGTAVVEKVLKFFQVATPDAFRISWQQPSVSFRRSHAFSINEPNTALWLRLLERSAGDVEVASYNPRELRAVAGMIPRLTTMSLTDGFIAARAALADAGVALTFVRSVEGTRVCAATWWIDADRPAIGITERQRKPDIFWFNLLHEIGHVVLHPRRSSYLNFDGADHATDTAEAEADDFAGRLLIPGDADHQIAAARSHRDLLLIAARLGVGVPTVAGRHGRLTGQWQLASKLRGKIADKDIEALERVVNDPAA